MSSNHQFIAGLLVGALAGAALAMFLNSEKGEELINDVQEGADKMQEDLALKLQEFDASLNDLFEKGRSFMEGLEQNTKQTPSQT